MIGNILQLYMIANKVNEHNLDPIHQHTFHSHNMVKVLDQDLLNHIEMAIFK